MQSPYTAAAVQSYQHPELKAVTDFYANNTALPEQIRRLLVWTIQQSQLSRSVRVSINDRALTLSLSKCINAKLWRQEHKLWEQLSDAAPSVRFESAQDISFLYFYPNTDESNKWAMRIIPDLTAIRAIVVPTTAPAAAPISAALDQS